MSKLSFQTVNQRDSIDIKLNANIGNKLVVNIFIQKLFLDVEVGNSKTDFLQKKTHLDFIVKGCQN